MAFGIGPLAGRFPWFGRSRAITRLSALGLAACLAACSSPPPPSYDLAASIAPSARAGALDGALEIADPTAGDNLDSDRIVIRTGPDTLAYLGNAQWSDRLPALLRARSNAAVMRARSIVAPGMVSDHQLAVDIRRFEVDVSTHEARIELSARIVSGRNGRVKATRLFSARAAAPVTANGAAARALETALAETLGAIVRWTAQTL